jgi:hypothetical protein
LPSAVAFAVARVAIDSATVWYFSTSTSVGVCSPASLPNGFCLLSTWAGRALPGLVVSPSRSRIVLLYSYVVRRRSGDRPGAIELH